MTDDQIAVSLRLGRFRLVVGSELGVTAMEIATTADQTQLDLDDIRGTARLLGAGTTIANFTDAIFLVDPTTENSSISPNVVTVEIHGASDSTLVDWLRGLDQDLQKGLLAESGFAARRQRFSDASVGLSQITPAEAKAIGRLDVPGNPLVNELLADRRRAVRSSKEANESLDLLATVDDLVLDLHRAVVFGAAGLSDASDEMLEDAIELAVEPDGWITRLRLLIAAEEISAIERLQVARHMLISHDRENSEPRTFDQLLETYAHQRQRADDLAQTLDDVVGRLSTLSEGITGWLTRRKELKAAKLIRETAKAYSSVVRTERLGERSTTSWLEAMQALAAMDRVFQSSEDQDKTKPRVRPPEPQSVEQAAGWLGDVFAKKLPEARSLVEDLARRNPTADTDLRVQSAKRQATARLARALGDTGNIDDTVAVLALALGLLRGFDSRTELEFQKIGQQILERVGIIAGIHARAGAGIPALSTAFEWFAQHVQPAVVEGVFQAMSGMKPNKPGAARDAYKMARSKVWRARHDRKVADAAAGGAAQALIKSIDAAAPRLIVRYVDRALPAPKQ